VFQSKASTERAADQESQHKHLNLALREVLVASGLVQSSLWTEVHRLESTVRYLGIEVDDALEISEQTEI